MKLFQPLPDEVVMEERTKNSLNGTRQLKLVESELTQLSLAELAAAINQSHFACQEKYKASLIEARKAGEFLLIAKTKVKQSPSGRWLVWLSENCPNISERTARAYMQIAREWEVIEKTATIADFCFKDVLKMLAEIKKVDKPVKEKNQSSYIPTQTTDDSSDVMDTDSVINAELTESEAQGDPPTLIGESTAQDKTPETKTEEQKMLSDTNQVDDVVAYTAQPTPSTTTDTATITYKQSTVVTSEVTIELIKNADVFSDEQVLTIFNALYSRFKRIGAVG